MKADDRASLVKDAWGDIGVLADQQIKESGNVPKLHHFFYRLGHHSTFLLDERLKSHTRSSGSARILNRFGNLAAGFLHIILVPRCIGDWKEGAMIIGVPNHCSTRIYAGGIRLRRN